MTESGAAAATRASSSSTGEAKELELSEEVMSEVHLGCPPRFSGPFVSHFTFSLPSLSEEMGGRFDGLVEAGRSIAGEVHGLDKDGDLVLPRRKKAYNVAIQHKITSSIPNVGLQVWKAALVLADFVLHISITSSDFDDISALELAAGTGFVGIILARVARKVFLTDRDAEILDNCATNAHLNSIMFKHHEASVHVRELDWKRSWPPSAGTCDIIAKRSEYSWALSEIEDAERVSLLLAADVIYSDELTNSFFSVLEHLMSRGSKKVLYLALEKRYNFSLDDLDVVANGYLHFRSFMRDEEGHHKNLELYVLPAIVVPSLALFILLSPFPFGARGWEVKSEAASQLSTVQLVELLFNSNIMLSGWQNAAGLKMHQRHASWASRLTWLGSLSTYESTKEEKTWRYGRLLMLQGVLLPDAETLR